MPLTRSVTAGNKNPSINEKAETKKTKAKPSKREAIEKEVESSPKKVSKKTDAANGAGNKKAKKGAASKKKPVKHESAEGEDPEIDETEDPLKSEATENEVESSAKVSKKATNGAGNKKGKKGAASKKQTAKLESAEEDDPEIAEADDTWQDAETIYEFKVNDIKGNEVSLDKYKGHVCVIVNVASKCGHTKSNYEQFVEIYDKYCDEKGLRILAFPCNQFSKQEPGDNDEICKFAEERNVKFDMFEKIEVNGKNAHPLWKFLTSKINGPKGKNIGWNFDKFVIDKEGKVVERHAAAMKPLKLVENLEKYW